MLLGDLCKKRKDPTPQKLSIVDEIIGNEDLAFLISSYLDQNVNENNPCIFNPCLVSRSWNGAFSLARAQKRYDRLIRHILRDDENSKDWIYHKVSYVHGPTADESGRSIPREGCVRIFRSQIHRCLKLATMEYRSNRANDQHHAIVRSDDRPDYYYRSHR